DAGGAAGDDCHLAGQRGARLGDVVGDVVDAHDALLVSSERISPVWFSSVVMCSDWICAGWISWGRMYGAASSTACPASAAISSKRPSTMAVSEAIQLPPQSATNGWPR